MSAAEIYRAVRRERLIAIVRGSAEEEIVNIAEALHQGGVTLMEITANTPGVMEMIRTVSQVMAGRMLIGAGTIVTPDLAREAVRAGARYVIAPDVNPEVIGFCVERGLAVIPGAATPTEILSAGRLGAKMIKLFPAGSLGLGYLKDLRGPLDQVDLVAVGGVTPENGAEFLRAGCVGVGIGSSLIRRDLVRAKNWDGLTALARRAISRLGAV